MVNFVGVLSLVGRVVKFSSIMKATNETEAAYYKPRIIKHGFKIKYGLEKKAKRGENS